MVQAAGCLYPHGVALMTVKLPERKRRAVIGHTRRILEERYVM